MLALLMLTVFSFRVRAQNLKPKDVPAPVRTAFKHDNPKIKDVEWSMDGNNYKVAYYDKNKDYVLTYDHEGSLVLTEVILWEKDIPKNIRDYTRKYYPQNKVKEAAIATSSNKITTYVIKLNGLSLLFDEDFNFISVKND